MQYLIRIRLNVKILSADIERDVHTAGLNSLVAEYTTIYKGQI